MMRLIIGDPMLFWITVLSLIRNRQNKMQKDRKEKPFIR